MVWVGKIDWSLMDTLSAIDDLLRVLKRRMLYSCWGSIWPISHFLCSKWTVSRSYTNCAFYILFLFLLKTLLNRCYLDWPSIYRGSPDNADFGIWKIPCQVKPENFSGKTWYWGIKICKVYFLVSVITQLLQLELGYFIKSTLYQSSQIFVIRLSYRQKINLHMYFRTQLIL